eukprot:308360-Pleurochrysis_carterae.AAC.2
MCLLSHARSSVRARGDACARESACGCAYPSIGWAKSASATSRLNTGRKRPACTGRKMGGGGCASARVRERERGEREKGERGRERSERERREREGEERERDRERSRERGSQTVKPASVDARARAAAVVRARFTMRVTERVAGEAALFISSMRKFIHSQALGKRCWVHHIHPQGTSELTCWTRTSVR